LSTTCGGEVAGPSGTLAEDGAVRDAEMWTTYQQGNMIKAQHESEDRVGVHRGRSIGLTIRPWLSQSRRLNLPPGKYPNDA
jgi:hypothetical protein